MRVLITGMGGELGTRVAIELEAADWVDRIVGVDSDPPRDRIGRTEFHLISPRDGHELVDLVREIEPTAIVHLGIYEPEARVSAKGAAQRTQAVALAALGAAAEVASVDRIIMRSGIEIYGRGRGTPTTPHEQVELAPTSPFGASLLRAESIGLDAAAASGAVLTRLRFAPLVGPHFPSPLGRYLRLPAVPVSALGELPFSLLHQEDATSAIVRALRVGHDGALNIASEGAVTASQAARMGGRLPVPVVGPGWQVAKVASEILGAPLPDHVRELLIRGRCADATLAGAVLDLRPQFTTPEVVKDLYEWASVTYLDPAERGAA